MNDSVSAFDSTEYDNKIKRTLPYYEEFYKQVIDAVRTHNTNALTWLDVGCGIEKRKTAIFGSTFCIRGGDIQVWNSTKNCKSYGNKKT